MQYIGPKMYLDTYKRGISKQIMLFWDNFTLVRYYIFAMTLNLTGYEGDF